MSAARPKSRAASSRRSRRRPPVARGAGCRVEPVESRTLFSGVLDTSFNHYGTLSIAPATGTARTAITAVQADERIVVAGIYTNSSGTSFTEVRRLTPTGAADPTFASGGTVTLNFTANSLLIDRDGTILVAGPQLERLNQDGTIDTAFGSGTGVVSLPFALVGVTVQTNGQILVAGNTSAGVPQVIRYNDDGSVDTSFGSGGTETLAIAGDPNSLYKVGAVSINANDQPIVSFAVNGDTTNATFGLVQLTTAGQFDQTFGIGGVAEVKGVGQNSLSGGIAVAPSGVIYQAGSYNYGSDTGSGYFMTYAANGQYASQSPLGGLDTFASSVSVTSDNKPIVVGTAVQGTGASKQTVITVDRFDAVTGNAPVYTPDTTWGGTGLVEITYNKAPSSLDSASVGDLGFSVYEQPNGGVVIGGTSVNPGTNVSTYNVTRLVGDASLAAGVGTITGTTFFDQNFNGTRDANDQGLSGFGAFIDANNNGVYDAGEVRVYSDANGLYTFNGLTPGTYHIAQIVPAGYTHTTPGSSATAEITVTVAANQTVLDQDFGLTGTDSISGTFFVDTNGNGVQDSGEPGINGGIVYLDLNNDGQLTSVDTSIVCSSTGTFTFTHLTPTTYHVRAILANGTTLTTPTSFPLNVTLTGNQQVTGILIGQS